MSVIFTYSTVTNGIPDPVVYNISGVPAGKTTVVSPKNSGCVSIRISNTSYKLIHNNTTSPAIFDIYVTDDTTSTKFSTVQISYTPPGTGVYFVRADGQGSDSNSGLNWSTAFATIAKALSMIDVTLINIASGTYNTTATLSIPKAVTINGSYSTVSFLPNYDSPSTIVGNSTYRLMENNGTYAVTVDGMAFKNGMHSSKGGGFKCFGGLTISNSVFSGNRSKSGGGLYVNSALTCTKCKFIDNTSTSRGGGLFCFSGQSTVASCTFLRNISSSGGACYVVQSTINDVIFEENQGYLGSCYIASSADINRCQFLRNSAREDANPSLAVTGGIYCVTPTPLNVSGSIFQGNICNPLGNSCIMSTSPNVHIVNSGFYGNLSNIGTSPFNLQRRGAIFCSGGSVINCDFSANTGAYGAAVFLNGNTTFTMINCSSTSNTSIGSLFYMNSTAAARITNCISWGNNSPTTNPPVDVYAATTMCNISSSILGTSSTAVVGPYSGTFTSVSAVDGPVFFTGATKIIPNYYKSNIASQILSTGDVVAYTTAAGPNTDIAGNPRFTAISTSQSSIDLGSRERPFITNYKKLCNPFVNLDNVIN